MISFCRKPYQPICMMEWNNAFQHSSVKKQSKANNGKVIHFLSSSVYETQTIRMGNPKRGIETHVFSHVENNY